MNLDSGMKRWGEVSIEELLLLDDEEEDDEEMM
jgi:hypothetical protein